MAHDPRVFKVGLIAGEDMQVSATHPHALDPDQGFAGLAHGYRALDSRERTRLVTDHSQHFYSPAIARGLRVLAKADQGAGSGGSCSNGR